MKSPFNRFSWRRLAAAAGLALATSLLGSAATAQDNFPPLLDPSDTVILMVDHQSGLMGAVGSIDHLALRQNVTALMKAAEYFDIPVIATTSAKDGPNGPLIPEVLSFAPNAVVIDRNGPINALDDAAFRRALEATGRRTVIIAGILTSVCVAFPALTAEAEGYNVYAVIDASGDVTPMASDVATTRMSTEGVKVTSTFGILSEIHQAWNAENAPTMAEVYSLAAPGYASVVQSFFAKGNGS